MVRLSDQPIDPAALLAEFLLGKTESGGVVSFTGLVRAEAGRVEALELEAYPGFTEGVIAGYVADAVARFDLDDAVVAHRVGRMAPGAPIVFVATAAKNRRAAFEAADFLMDHLKSKAPFWKKSHQEDGARWIEPRPDDHADIARWSAE